MFTPLPGFWERRVRKRSRCNFKFDSALYRNKSVVTQSSPTGVGKRQGTRFGFRTYYLDWTYVVLMFARPWHSSQSRSEPSTKGANAPQGAHHVPWSRE